MNDEEADWPNICVVYEHPDEQDDRAVHVVGTYEEAVKKANDLHLEGIADIEIRRCRPLYPSNPIDLDSVIESIHEDAVAHFGDDSFGPWEDTQVEFKSFERAEKAMTDFWSSFAKEHLYTYMWEVGEELSP